MPKLELAQKKQLERWIGSGPKTFELLYSFTRDGASASTFHELCDNKGPTVTVLYNTEGSVYGGYAETSWNSNTAAYYPNKGAFLFRLAHSEKPAYDKFPNKTGTHGIYCHSTYGPLFGAGQDSVKPAAPYHFYETKSIVTVDDEPVLGAGPDLNTFNGDLTLQGQHYTLNGGMNFGKTYDMKGLNQTQITNDVMTVLDLEVYAVSDSALDVKWRESPEWNPEYLQRLKQEVEQYSPHRKLKLKAANILILGPCGAGKSSFFNSIASVFRGYVTGQASSGSAEQSITSKYRMYSIRQSATGRSMKFRLCDTRGLEESQGIDCQEIDYILDGNVPDGYQFNPSMSISSNISGFKKTPSLNDKIHCVCFVIDGSTVNVLSEKMLERIKAIKSKVHQKGVPQVILVTKIDKICSHVEEDLSTVFQSQAVSEMVDNVSQLLGFPRGHVLPMKNYEKEIEVSDNMNILTLLSLRQMLRATEDFMFNCMDSVEAINASEVDE